MDRLYADLASETAVREAEGLLRTVRPVGRVAGPVIDLDGRSYISFASNNYLGLAQHPEVIAAAVEAARQWGAGSSASRLISGSLQIHHDLEAAVAAFKGTEAAAVFPTGYMANLGLITALAANEDLIFLDKLSHASLIDAARLSEAPFHTYPHNRVDLLENHLVKFTKGRRRVFILTDGVFSMDGDLAPLPDLAALAEKYGAILIVDDAHGTGVLGATGRGTVEHFGLHDAPLIQMGTFSKALGSLGGFVAGPRALIQTLHNHARSFIYSTALAPAAAGAARAALALVDREPERRERLHARSQQLRQGLTAQGAAIEPCPTPIVPLIIGGAEAAVAAAAHLLDRGFYAPAIRPPTVPPKKSRLRFCLTADHSPDQVNLLLEGIQSLPPTHITQPQGKRGR